MDFDEFLTKYHLRNTGFEDYLQQYTSSNDYTEKHSKIIAISDNAIPSLIKKFKQYNMNHGLQQLNRQKADSIVHEKVAQHMESVKHIRALSVHNDNVQPDLSDERHLIKCPRCGSTQISTGARGWKWTTGVIGSGKTVNRCANCGKTWEPYYRK